MDDDWIGDEKRIRNQIIHHMKVVQIRNGELHVWTIRMTTSLPRHDEISSIRTRDDVHVLQSVQKHRQIEG